MVLAVTYPLPSKKKGKKTDNPREPLPHRGGGIHPQAIPASGSVHGGSPPYPPPGLCSPPASGAGLENTAPLLPFFPTVSGV